jgi:hypothetical protein
MVLSPVTVLAAQSSITEAEGYACMGVDHSIKETEQAALTDAKRNAGESAASWIRSKTRVEDFKLKTDLIWAYMQGTVKVIKELEREWYKDPRAGDCLRLTVQAEVIPESSEMARIHAREESPDDPALPLQVRIWTEQEQYRAGETIQVFLRGNRPFYARVMYRDVTGQLTQLLPNPYRADNYFNGGVTYRIPGGSDKFELAVTPPFGKESIKVFASSEPLGAIGLSASGPVYKVTTPVKDVERAVRGIQLRPASGDAGTAADFVEAEAQIVVLE